MDLVATVRKEGSRGGRADFKWTDVQTNQHRENYLGHSLMAPVGRWQKGKDLSWYAKGDDDASSDPADAAARAQQERAEELQLVKQAEQDALNKALGYELNLDGPLGDGGTGTGANAVAVKPGKKELEMAVAHRERQAREGHGEEEGERRRKRRERSREGEKRHRRHNRRRSRSRSKGDDRRRGDRDHDGHAQRDRDEQDRSYERPSRREDPPGDGRHGRRDGTYEGRRGRGHSVSPLRSTSRDRQRSRSRSFERRHRRDRDREGGRRRWRSRSPS